MTERPEAARCEEPGGAEPAYEQHSHGHAHSHVDDHGHAHSHGHSHSHGDDHGHAHSHGHSHSHGPSHSGGDSHSKRSHGQVPGRGAGPSPDPHHPHGMSLDEDPRPALQRGCGAGRVLFLDAPSGLAGDMTVAALLDLGVPLSEVQASLDCLAMEGFAIHHRRRFAGAIGASQFDVEIVGRHPERSYATIERMLGESPLREPVRELSLAIFRRLAEAEAEVHRATLESVHFHEVGAVDAIVDIVAAATCIDFLGAEVVCSPLPMGGGRVRCRHGVIPLPAPATLLCLRGVPTYEAGIDAELVTPTGAAIVATVARGFARWPSFAPERVGWGKGTQVLPDRLNALRAVLGSPWPRAAADAPSHYVVEANVDDLTGELAGHTLSALMSGGALDAWLTPIQMKKGRPGLTISALCRAGEQDAVGAILLRETSSIGFRKSAVTRGERPREILRVQTEYGEVDVKVSTGPWGSPQLKPEFDQCAQIARSRGVPVRDVLSSALAAAREGRSGASQRS